MFHPLIIQAVHGLVQNKQLRLFHDTISPSNGPCVLVTLYGSFNTVWGVELEAATDDWENRQVREDHSVVFTSWVVIP